MGRPSSRKKLSFPRIALCANIFLLCGAFYLLSLCQVQSEQASNDLDRALQDNTELGRLNKQLDQLLQETRRQALVKPPTTATPPNRQLTLENSQQDANLLERLRQAEAAARIAQSAADARAQEVRETQGLLEAVRVSREGAKEQAASLMRKLMLARKELDFARRASAASASSAAAGGGGGGSGNGGGSGGGCSSDPWLVMGIPTVPRRGVDYLTPTLASLASEMATEQHDPFYGKLCVVVVNNAAPGQRHSAFVSARQRMAGHALGSSFVFLGAAAGGGTQGSAAAAVGMRYDANVPGPKVQKQTRDVVRMLRLVIAKYGGSSSSGGSSGSGSGGSGGPYFLFMEDDFRFCPHALRASHYLLQKAHAYAPRWLAIRASYGLNGVFMKRADLPAVADYMTQHVARRPPDHLMVEWFAGETAQSKQYKGDRPHLAFKYNLFQHLGARSSLRDSLSPAYPVCFEELKEPVQFKVEAFNAIDCPGTDLWPCTPRPDSAPSPPPPPVDWGQLFHKISRQYQPLNI